MPLQAHSHIMGLSIGGLQLRFTVTGTSGKGWRIFHCKHEGEQTGKEPPGQITIVSSNPLFSVSTNHVVSISPNENGGWYIPTLSS